MRFSGSRSDERRMTDPSFLGFTGSRSVISGNGLAGIRAGGGSLINLANVTISNNGIQGFGGQLTSSGVVATGGTSITLTSAFGAVDAPIDISGHARAGIVMDEGTLGTGTVGTAGSIHIHDNGEVGVEMAGGHAFLSSAAVKFDGNGSGGRQLAVFGGILEMGGGVQVQGGVEGGLNANIVIGDTDGTGGPMPITGALTLEGGSSQHCPAPILSGRSPAIARPGRRPTASRQSAPTGARAVRPSRSTPAPACPAVGRCHSADQSHSTTPVC